MTKPTYELHLVYVNGTERVLTLDTPHRLVPDTMKPHALTYEDDGKMHNIPFSSILDFWFSAKDYNQCDKQTVEGTVLRLPTRGCQCEACKAAVEKIKGVANSL